MDCYREEENYNSLGGILLANERLKDLWVKHWRATMNHLPDCAVGNIQPCDAGFSQESERPEQHWFSGWPGAWCLKCGAEDPREVCLAGCLCPCHDDEHPEQADTALVEDEVKL